jgi:hypothetical protein
MRRVIVIAIFFAVALIVTLIGTLTPLTAQEAEGINEGINESFNTINSMPPLDQVTAIWGNNLLIALIGFVPMAGTFFELFILWDSGVGIAAITYGKTNPTISFLSILPIPVAWLEFIGYSIGLSEGLWLFWRLRQKRGRRELRNACFFVAVVVVTLLLAAIIEVALLQLLG